MSAQDTERIQIDAISLCGQMVLVVVANSSGVIEVDMGNTVAITITEVAINLKVNVSIPIVLRPPSAYFLA